MKNADNKKIREIKSETYRRIILWLTQDVVQKMAKELGGMDAAIEAIGTTRAPFYGYRNFNNIPNADLFCSWLDAYGGKIWLPGDPPPGMTFSEEELFREVELLRNEVAALNQKNMKNEAVIEYLENKISSLENES